MLVVFQFQALAPAAGASVTIVRLTRGSSRKLELSQSTDHDLRVFYGRWSVCEVSIEDYSNYRSTLGPLNEEAALMYCRVQANWWLDAPGLWPGPVEDGSPPHSNHSLDAALEKKKKRVLHADVWG